MPTEFKYAGTVSHGTMRSEDLIPCFIGVLEDLNPEHAQLADWREWPTDYDEDGTMFLIEDLFDALNTVAPDGYYFGANEGDGSDYGFWATDEVGQ